jgi:phosphatidylethanolamine-binding protein (PEBP) family uncharacterized protein
VHAVALLFSKLPKIAAGLAKFCRLLEVSFDLASHTDTPKIKESKMSDRFRAFAISAFSAAFLSFPVQAFDIGFDWAGLKSCTSGNPGTVDSPTFTLSDVPAGTKYLRFKLVDRNVPGFNHGGGIVAWDGSPTIPSGAFKYKQPCPPNGSHTYEWQATAQTEKKGGKLGATKAQRKYPE